MRERTHLLLLLVILRDIKDRWHVIAKVEFLQRCLDMLACNGLLRVLFGDFVGFGGDEGNELDTALDEEVARVFRKGHARLGGQYVLNNLLYGCCDAISCVRAS